eukprot:5510758-Pyramimonas_sp.AAC.1
MSIVFGRIAASVFMQVFSVQAGVLHERVREDCRAGVLHAAVLHAGERQAGVLQRRQQHTEHHQEEHHQVAGRPGHHHAEHLQDGRDESQPLQEAGPDEESLWEGQDVQHSPHQAAARHERDNAHLRRRGRAPSRATWN